MLTQTRCWKIFALCWFIIKDNAGAESQITGRWSCRDKSFFNFRRKFYYRQAENVRSPHRRIFSIWTMFVPVARYQTTSLNGPAVFTRLWAGSKSRPAVHEIWFSESLWHRTPNHVSQQMLKPESEPAHISFRLIKAETGESGDY